MVTPEAGDSEKTCYTKSCSECTQNEVSVCVDCSVFSAFTALHAVSSLLHRVDIRTLGLLPGVGRSRTCRDRSRYRKTISVAW